MTGESAMHENAAATVPNHPSPTKERAWRDIGCGSCHRPYVAPPGGRRNQSGRSVPSSPGGTKRAVGIMVSGGNVSLGLRENIMRCSLALEMKKG